MNLHERALEAAHVVYERYGQSGDLKTARTSDDRLSAIIAAYNSTLLSGDAGELVRMARAALEEAHKACFNHPDRRPMGMSHGPFSGVNFALGALASVGTQNSAQKATISALVASNAEMREALGPFAEIADLIDSETEGMSETDELELHYHDYLMASWPVSLFRTARRAREQGGSDA